MFDILNIDCYNLTGSEMNIKVDVDDLKPEEQDMQTGMLATESVRCQEVQQPTASVPSAASGSVSYPQREDLQTLKEKIFLSIVSKYLQTTPLCSSEEHSMFKEYVAKMKFIITGTDILSCYGKLLWTAFGIKHSRLLGSVG